MADDYSFPIDGGGRLEFSQCVVDVYKRWFDVDVEVELRRARQWLEANPDRQKCPRLTVRFLDLWLIHASKDAHRGPR
jgi:hypothetical protein